MTADSTADEVRALGRRSIGLEVDVTDAAATAQAIARIVAEWGRLDVVVCNAGGGIGRIKDSRASEVDLAQFDTVIKRNLYGTVHTCVAAAPTMKRQGSGKIITVSSRAGLRPSADGGYAHYGAAKAAIIMYTQYLAQDLGPHGINVNCIAPGSIGTGRLQPSFDRAGDTLIDTIGMRRIGTTEDCAGVVAFLATSASDYLNGAVIPIDGGARS